MIASSRVSVGIAATALYSGDADASSVLIRNAGSAAVDLGGSGVTSGAGFELAAGESVSLDIHGGSEVVYGIAATGTVIVHVLQSGVS